MNSLKGQPTFLDWCEFATTTTNGALAYDFYKYSLGISTLSDFPDFVRPPAGERTVEEFNTTVQRQLTAVTDAYTKVMNNELPTSTMNGLQIRDAFNSQVNRKIGYNYDIQNQIEQSIYHAKRQNQQQQLNQQSLYFHNQIQQRCGAYTPLPSNSIPMNSGNTLVNESTLPAPVTSVVESLNPSMPAVPMSQVPAQPPQAPQASSSSSMTAPFNTMQLDMLDTNDMYSMISIHTNQSNNKFSNTNNTNTNTTGPLIGNASSVSNIVCDPVSINLSQFSTSGRDTQPFLYNQTRSIRNTYPKSQTNNTNTSHVPESVNQEVRGSNNVLQAINECDNNNINENMSYVSKNEKSKSLSVADNGKYDRFLKDFSGAFQSKFNNASNTQKDFVWDFANNMHNNNVDKHKYLRIKIGVFMSKRGIPITKTGISIALSYLVSSWASRCRSKWLTGMEKVHVGHDTIYMANEAAHHKVYIVNQQLLELLWLLIAHERQTRITTQRAETVSHVMTRLDTYFDKHVKTNINELTPFVNKASSKTSTKTKDKTQSTAPTTDCSPKSNNFNNSYASMTNTNVHVTPNQQRFQNNDRIDQSLIHNSNLFGSNGNCDDDMNNDTQSILTSNNRHNINTNVSGNNENNVIATATHSNDNISNKTVPAMTSACNVSNIAPTNNNNTNSSSFDTNMRPNIQRQDDIETILTRNNNNGNINNQQFHQSSQPPAVPSKTYSHSQLSCLESKTTQVIKVFAIMGYVMTKNNVRISL